MIEIAGRDAVVDAVLGVETIKVCSDEVNILAGEIVSRSSTNMGNKYITLTR